MIAELRDLNTFRRAGFLKNGTVLSILLILPSIAVAAINLFYKEPVHPILITAVLFCDLLVACLAPLTITNLFSMNRYVLYNTLPIRSRNILKLLYFNTYAVICVSFVLTGVFNCIQFGLYFLAIQLLKMGLSLCLSNIFIPMMASGEFKEPTETKSTVVVTIMVSWILVVTMIFTVAILTDSQLFLNALNSYTAKIIVIMLAVIANSAAIITLKKSLNSTTKKVRLIW